MSGWFWALGVAILVNYAVWICVNNYRGDRE